MREIIQLGSNGMGNLLERTTWKEKVKKSTLKK